MMQICQTEAVSRGEAGSRIAGDSIDKEAHLIHFMD